MAHDDVSVSSPKLEKVVNPPRMPTKTKTRAVGVMERRSLVLIPALTLLCGQMAAEKGGAMQATKPTDREIVLTRTFAAPRQAVFDAVTQAKHLVHWMKQTSMSLVACEVDLRTGGSFRYVFQRASGAKLEVRGAYGAVDPPTQFTYTETYDFSPLTLRVSTALEEVRGETVFKQTLVYPSKHERDGDWDAVVTSSTEAYANLERYLRSSR